MFLYQKLKYNFIDIFELAKVLKEEKPRYITFDTETTGLDFIEDVPFLVSVAFNDKYTLFTPTKTNMKMFFDAIDESVYVFAHNAKYDWHMLYNNDTKFPDNLTIADSLIVARLTTFADDDESISLENLGTLYVDENAKFAGAVIKKKLNEINKERIKYAKQRLKDMLPKNMYLYNVWTPYLKRVQFVETENDDYYEVLDEIYSKPNYLDVYLENKNLMESYAIDDVVILNEYLKKSLPVLEKTIGFDGVFKQECDLIKVVGEFERNGVKADIAYLLKSRQNVYDYIEKIYKELYKLTEQTFTSGQHEVIMKLMAEKYSIPMRNCDKKALLEITDSAIATDEAKQVAKYIIELRTLDKWLSTYIDGMLNRIKNGRIYTDIKNYGAVTGRVSSDLQQQPKDALLDREGNELFHPRKVFINDDDYTTYYFDYSQMELRVQAHYVLSLSDDTSKLARAFMPHNCKHALDGNVFKYGVDDIDDIWLDEENNIWKPIDVHTETTLKAFPSLTIDNPNFDHYRSLGKRCNFLKNYGGGARKIAEALDISTELAVALDKAYYEAFPEVRTHYQNYVNSVLYKYGYIDNLRGRRYYIQNSSNYYKVHNYLVQGSCADILKEKEVVIDGFFKELGVKSKILLPVHDELQISIYNGEEWLIPKIKAIMDDVPLKVPMVCDVEKTDTNWAEKYKIEVKI